MNALTLISIVVAVLSAAAVCFIGYRLFLFGIREGRSRLKSRSVSYVTIFSGLGAGIFILFIGVLLFASVSLEMIFGGGPERDAPPRYTARLEQDDLASLDELFSLDGIPESKEDIEEEGYMSEEAPDDAGEGPAGEDDVLALLGITEDGAESLTLTDTVRMGGTSGIDQILLDLKDANIAFNTPDTMRMGRSYSVILLMSEGLSGDVLSAEIRRMVPDSAETGTLHVDTVKVSPRMEALLNGNGFSVQPVTPIAQLVRKQGETRWEWIVTPREKGIKTLFLTLNALIEYQGEKTTQTVETYRKNIQVYVEPMDMVLSWLNRHLSIIGSLFGVMLGAVITHRLALSRQRKQSEGRSSSSPS